MIGFTGAYTHSILYFQIKYKQSCEHIFKSLHSRWWVVLNVKQSSSRDGLILALLFLRSAGNSTPCNILHN